MGNCDQTYTNDEDSQTNKNKTVEKSKIYINLKAPNLCSCPSCGEIAGGRFKGSGPNKESFYCLKCGVKKSNRNYYLCNKCNSIFCFQCPQKNNENLASCPSCGESAGENFKGSGTTEENYYCLKCGKLDGLDEKNLKDEAYYDLYENYYHFDGIKRNFFVCYKCKGIFCYKCPYLKHEIFSKCPSCGEPVGEYFTGSCDIQNMQYSGIDKHTFDCLKCGKRIEDSNYYKCDKCNCLFCPKCVF